MTLELARRLLDGGAVAALDVEGALLDAAAKRCHFLSALLERAPSALVLVDQELGRLWTQAPLVADHVHGTPTLMNRLPPGICESLLAVPIGYGDDGVVEVAAADPLDAHVVSELSFHLGEPVRVVRASVGTMLHTLKSFAPAESTSWRPIEEREDERTPAFGSRSGLRPDRVQPTRPPSEAPSAPPIPLVRRSLAPPSAWPIHGTSPGVGGGAALTGLGEDEAGEPIIGLFRSKALLPEALASEPPSDWETADAEPSAARPEQARGGNTLERVRAGLAILDALETADSPESVVELLVRGCSGVASHVLVLAARGSEHQGRQASAAVSAPHGVRSLRVREVPGGIFEHATEEGHYFGPIPSDEAHADLRQAFGAASDEIYLTTVNVAGRPALSVLLGGMVRAFAATEQADTLVEAGSAALARILRKRKG